MAEATFEARMQQLYAALRPWQHQYDLLLRYVETRVIELDRLSGRWPAFSLSKARDNATDEQREA